MSKCRVTAVVAAGVFFLASACTFTPLDPRAIAWFLGGRYIDDVDVIHQRSRHDCGVAALEMVLRHFGRTNEALDSLRLVSQRRARGLSFGDLQDKASSLGLDSHGWTMTTGDLGSVPLPAVVHFPGHFLVLDSLGRGWFYLRDPSSGRIRMTPDSFRRRWSGRILVFGPTS